MQRLGDVTLEGTRFRPGETLDPGGRSTGYELAALRNGDLEVESMAGGDGLFVTDPRR